MGKLSLKPKPYVATRKVEPTRESPFKFDPSQLTGEAAMLWETAQLKTALGKRWGYDVSWADEKKKKESKVRRRRLIDKKLAKKEVMFEPTEPTIKIEEVDE